MVGSQIIVYSQPTSDNSLPATETTNPARAIMDAPTTIRTRPSPGELVFASLTAPIIDMETPMPNRLKVMKRATICQVEGVTILFLFISSVPMLQTFPPIEADRLKNRTTTLTGTPQSGSHFGVVRSLYLYVLIRHLLLYLLNISGKVKNLRISCKYFIDAHKFLKTKNLQK